MDTTSNAELHTDDWHSWGHHVLSELRRQNDNIEELEKSHVALCIKVGMLRVYLAIIGAVSGMALPFVIWKVFA